MPNTANAVHGGARLKIRLFAPVFGILVGFCAISAHFLLETHRATWGRAADTATSMVAAIRSDVIRNIETLDLSLQAVIDGLKFPGLDQMNPELRHRVLFDRSATARHLGTILVIDET